MREVLQTDEDLDSYDDESSSISLNISSVNSRPFAKSTSHFYDGQENSAFWNSMIDVEDIVDYGDLC